MAEEQPLAMPTKEEVDKFLALKSHEEKCVHFNANPPLAMVFRGVLFPKPENSAAVTDAPLQ